MKKVVSIVALCAIAVSAMAMPARREGFVRTAEDGTEKLVYLHGNATFHYMTDSKGNWLDEKTLMPLNEEAKAARIQKGQARIQARRVQQEQMVGNTPNIAPRGLVILVNFKDKSFVTPVDTIKNMMDGENFTRDYKLDYTYQVDNGYGGTQTVRVRETIHASGSARKYFQDQSFGAYNPQFDVMGPYTLSQDYSYYGSNNVYGEDEKVEYMVKEACQLANADGADFTLYDNDNDGYVDFVYVLYAGYGEADGGPENTVWPHNYALSYTKVSCTVDGKKVDNYACSNEMQYYGQVYNGIGTFCHEFSHVMGLPDLYETNNPQRGIHTLVDWDILDYGPYNNDGNTPPAYSAYERFFCGWITPRVLTDPENVTLNPLNDSKEALLMCSGNSHNLVGYNPSPTTFYLIENRKKEGWDAYLPGEGMLLTKIQYSATKWEQNTVNNTASKMGVDLIEAKTNTGDLGAATDAFPKGATYYTTFTNHEIRNITRSNNVIRFEYRGGAQGVEDVTEEKAVVKRIENGQVVIVRDGKKYDILGNRL